MTLRSTVASVAPRFVRRWVNGVEDWYFEHTPRHVRECSVNGLDVRMYVSTPVERMRARTYATKEPETLQWIDENLRPGDILFDIGANVGIYSLYAASRVPASSVYSFEPESQNFARLCQNIVLNGLKNVTPCSFPLADGERIDVFYVSSVEPGYSLHSFGQRSDYISPDKAEPFRQGAFACSMDTAIRKYNLPQPNMIKLDVDGIEALILSGARDTLANPALRTLLVEWNFRDQSEVDRLSSDLAGAGLSLVRRSSWIADGPDGLKSQNMIFARTEGK